MTPGAEIRLTPGGAKVIPAPALPLTRLLVGKTAAEAAALLPRLFNLCPQAQEQAARLSLGLPPLADTRAETIRAHRNRLFIALPLALGLPPRPGCQDAPGLTRGLDLNAFLASDAPLSALARHLRAAFPPGAALARPLPFPRGAQALAPSAFENSPAGRQAQTPLMQALEDAEGRSPFWRLIGLMADLDAALAGALPPDTPGPTATVQAARGTYALRIETHAGRVTALTRRTPTDHLMAPGGAVEQSMATCPAPLAPLLLALHDPCVAVAIREAQDA